MDPIKDSLADQNHRRRRRKQHTKIRCFLGCFGGGGGTSEEDDKKLPQKLKSINQSRRWFSCLKLGRKENDSKRTVPENPDTVDSQAGPTPTHEKIDHVKGRFVLGRSKSKSKYNKMISDYEYDEIISDEKGPTILGRSKSKPEKMVSAYNELPVKGDNEVILNQAPVAGEVLREKTNKTRSSSGKGSIFLRNSKSMNHIQQQQQVDEEKQQQGGPTRKSSLRKSKSAKTTTLTTLINQPVVGSQLIRPSTMELSLSQSQSDIAHVPQQEITTGGVDDDDDENRVVATIEEGEEEEKKKRGRIDRVVGISIIVMVLVIMAVWGKLCAILCSSAWLYFYPLLLRAHNHNNKNGTPRHIHVAPTKESNKSQWLKKKVVFEGFLQRDR